MIADVWTGVDPRIIRFVMSSLQKYRLNNTFYVPVRQHKGSTMFCIDKIAAFMDNIEVQGI